MSLITVAFAGIDGPDEDPPEPLVSLPDDDEEEDEEELVSCGTPPHPHKIIASRQRKML
jgi:hypothetical protein